MTAYEKAKTVPKKALFREQLLPEAFRLDSFLRQLILVGLEAQFEAVHHAIGGVGGTTDGIDLFVEGFIGSETVPGFVKAAVHDALGKVGRFLILQQNDILDASIGIQSY